MGQALLIDDPLNFGSAQRRLRDARGRTRRKLRLSLTDRCIITSTIMPAAATAPGVMIRRHSQVPVRWPAALEEGVREYPLALVAKCSRPADSSPFSARNHLTAAREVPA